MQRVKRCAVYVGEECIGETGTGLLVLLGVAVGDGVEDATYLADKILNLRIFPDDQDRMNLSVVDIGGGVMVVSQFTLLADCRKGRRPSFVGAADPSRAEPLYRHFVDLLSRSGLDVRKGEFGAMMDVRLDNWGPVTLVIDTAGGLRS